MIRVQFRFEPLPGAVSRTTGQVDDHFLTPGRCGGRHRGANAVGRQARVQNEAISDLARQGESLLTSSPDQ
jgi:hypothetical protein